MLYYNHKVQGTKERKMRTYNFMVYCEGLDCSVSCKGSTEAEAFNKVVDFVSTTYLKITGIYRNGVNVTADFIDC